MPDTMVTIVPYFKVPADKMDDFKAAMAGCSAAVKTGTPDCLFYGFTICGDEVHCREAYKSGEAAVQHIKDVGEPLGKMAPFLQNIAVMGPAAELAKTKEAFDPIGATYWETDSGSIAWPSRMPKACPDTHVTIVPYWKVPDGKMEEFKASFEAFYSGVAGGTSDCLYYGFCCTGNKALCREGYLNAEAVLQHVGKDVSDPLGKAVALVGEGGLDIAVMGPASELEKLKPTFDAFGTKYWEVQDGAFWM